jgi:predicted SAM-dependent methyltransferase
MEQTRRRGGYGRFARLELLPDEAPFSGELLGRLGLRGLNCGCGLALKPGWLNSDMLVLKDEAREKFTEPERIARIDEHAFYLEHDATTSFPLEDGCLDWVYSEHFIEHVGPEQGVAWLADVRRMLRPGGTVRISTPDLRRYVSGYVEKDRRFFSEHADRLRDVKKDVSDRGGWMMNQIFYDWGHRWIYDLEELAHAAASAGFDPAAVVERSFRQGADPDVSALDREWRSDESLYVEITRT